MPDVLTPIHWVFDGSSSTILTRQGLMLLLDNLVKITGLVRLGTPFIHNDGVKCVGFQMIAESHIAVHGEGEGRYFVDVFSCKPFKPYMVTTVLRKHLGGKWKRRQIERNV